MHSWKTPALLATVGLCGLGSLFAQGPTLPTLSEPTLIEVPALPSDSSAIQQAPVPMPLDSVAPESVPEATVQPLPQHQGHESVPVNSQTLPEELRSDSSCEGCTTSAPVESTSWDNAPEVVAAPVVQYAPADVQSPCGCQSGSVWSSGVSRGADGVGYQGYTMGSGSGVMSGVLSPNANSSGLHTRYPLYNYRHPWFYQGPPSQNVTIVW